MRPYRDRGDVGEACWTIVKVVATMLFACLGAVTVAATIWLCRALL